eukprot:TRINITY_DN6601_c0_g1_i1.p1 TRINITY_DN6601_c0_g1~~TRINITY_DN6601_c0_g1_i1.p1  ORF type:complete len:387 (+),score=25.70 TRINITY_DN6601_c0_g1_i1:160-1320(+)
MYSTLALAKGQLTSLIDGFSMEQFIHSQILSPPTPVDYYTKWDSTLQTKSLDSLDSCHPIIIDHDANKQSTGSYLIGLLSFLSIFGSFYVLFLLLLFLLYQIFINGSLFSIAIICVLFSTCFYPSKILWHDFVNLSLWRSLREYFSFRVIIEGAKFDNQGKIQIDWYNPNIDTNKKQYLFVEFPHGVIPFGFILRITISHLILPGLRIEQVIASTLLMVPIISHLCRWLGAHPATKKEINSIIDRGSSVSLLPGGVAEIFLSSKETEKIFLKNRKGFVKIALERGLSLVPVYHFGNTQLYDYCGLSSLSRKVRISCLAFYGRFFSPIPYQHPIMMVVGRPIEVKRVENPTEAEVDDLHAKFVGELKNLFDKYKAQFGWAHKELEIL